MSDVAYRRRSDVLWRRALDTVLCLPPGATEPVTLAGTGPEVWDLLQAPRSFTELVGELGARHSADPAVIAMDVRPVLDQLAVLGLVVRVF